MMPGVMRFSVIPRTPRWLPHPLARMYLRLCVHTGSRRNGTPRSKSADVHKSRGPNPLGKRPRPSFGTTLTVQPALYGGFPRSPLPLGVVLFRSGNQRFAHRVRLPALQKGQGQSSFSLLSGAGRTKAGQQSPHPAPAPLAPASELPFLKLASPRLRARSAKDKPARPSSGRPSSARVASPALWLGRSAPKDADVSAVTASPRRPTSPGEAEAAPPVWGNSRGEGIRFQDPPGAERRESVRFANVVSEPESQYVPSALTEEPQPVTRKKKSISFGTADSTDVPRLADEIPPSSGPPPTETKSSKPKSLRFGDTPSSRMDAGTEPEDRAMPLPARSGTPPGEDDAPLPGRRRMVTPGLAPAARAATPDGEDEAGSAPKARGRMKTPGLSPAVAAAEQVAVGAPQNAEQQPRFGRGRRQSVHSLDQSLDSLNFFRLRQSGRLAAAAAAATTSSTLPTEADGEGPQLRRQQPAGTADAGAASQPRGSLATLPRGTVLEIEVLSTWGDVKYVGLNGLQLFTDTGEEVTSFRSVEVDPEDEHHIIPAGDPRLVGNLVNGVYRTTDLLHMWLAPFRSGTRLIVTITLFRPATIAMLRVWNYNESRVYTDRGVRDMQMRLDGRRIFHGEIGRAPGHTRPHGDSCFGEVILFTGDEGILEAVAEHDGALMDASSEVEMRSSALVMASTLQRPSTGGGERQSAELELAVMEDTWTDDLARIRSASGRGWKAQVVQLSFDDTWGDRHYLGLTGLAVVAADGGEVPLHIDALDAAPRDLNELPNVQGDLRTLDKLIDGTNVTSEDKHMWMIPFKPGGDHLLTVTLARSCELSGLRVWNYNKSPSDTARGAKRVRVLLDDRDISPPSGFLLRRAPGHEMFDFVQELRFDEHQDEAEESCRGLTAAGPPEPGPLAKLVPDYVCQVNPTMLLLTLRILGSCGDPFYVGLNGIQFIALSGEPIRVLPSQINAMPHSINVLEDHTGDVRTPDKLVDGVNETYDDRHMWLTPMTPGLPNVLEFYFDVPVTLGAVRFWNYSKTPSRGVRRFQMFADNAIIYDGHLKAAAPSMVASAAPWSPTEQVDTHQAVLFSSDPVLMDKEASRLVPFNARDEAVRLVDEGSLLLEGADSGQAPPVGQRPKTMYGSESCPSPMRARARARRASPL